MHENDMALIAEDVEEKVAAALELGMAKLRQELMAMIGAGGYPSSSDTAAIPATPPAEPPDPAVLAAPSDPPAGYPGDPPAAPIGDPPADPPADPSENADPVSDPDPQPDIPSAAAPTSSIEPVHAA